MASENSNKEIETIARGIKLLLMDCDGVLTDGRLYFSGAGEEMKVFDVRDGQGLVSWHKAGGISGIISGRSSRIVDLRAAELGIKFVHQRVEDKIQAFLAILAEAYISDPAQVAYIGDDVPDILLMKKVGLPVAVADAVSEVREAAIWVTSSAGGRGAVREVCDLLLSARPSVAPASSWLS